MSHIRALLVAAFVAIASPAFADTGIASWYGWAEHGKPMANGKAFHALGTSGASRKLPLGTLVRVTNLANGRHANVLIEDRGPYVGGRVIDVSLGTARVLGFEHAGLAKVRVDVIQPARRRVKKSRVARK